MNLWLAVGVVLLVEAAGVAAIVAIGVYWIAPVRARAPAPAAAGASYADDVAQWARGQAAHIRAGRWNAVDREHVANELVGVAKLVEAAKEVTR